MTSLRTLLWMLLLLACACSSDPPEDEPVDHGNFDDNDPVAGPCFGETWRGPDEARAWGTCFRIVDVRTTCICADGHYENVQTVRCDEALLEYCGVDLDEPGFCGDDARGHCWNTEDESEYLCRCAHNDATSDDAGEDDEDAGATTTTPPVRVRNESCEEALVALCGGS